MADNTTQQPAEVNTQATGGTAAAAQTGAAAQSGQQDLFTQEDVNRIVGERLKREREKWDVEGLKAKAAELEGERDQLKASIAHRDLLDKVVSETGVPRELVHGETEDEMRANAQAIAAYAGSFATPPTHPTDKGGAATPAPATRDSILAIGDEDARRQAIADNIELFG